VVRIPEPIITREHGSWAVLFVPIIVGAAVPGVCTLHVALLTTSALGLFLSYVPLQMLLRELGGARLDAERLRASRFWAAIYVGVAIAFFIPLLLEGYWQLVLIAGGAAIFFLTNFSLTRFFEKSILSDLAAVAGLTLGAPGSYYVATGLIDLTAGMLWIMNFLFFGSGVFYVYMKIRAAGVRKPELTWADKLSLGKLNLIYHFVVVSILIVMTAQHSTPQLALVAFVPMMIHAIYGTLKLSSRVRFRQLGFLLLAQSALFGFLLSIVAEMK